MKGSLRFYTEMEVSPLRLPFVCAEMAEVVDRWNR